MARLKLKLPRLSLSWRIGFSYLLTAIMFLALAYLLHRASDDGLKTQLSIAENSTKAACDEIQRKFSWGLANNSFAKTKEVDFQNAVLQIILDHFDGVEGGIWTAKDGFQSYAYPTYDGASPKKDVPRSEMASLKALSEKVLFAKTQQVSVWKGRREAVLSVACPVGDAKFQGAVWTLTRVPMILGTEFDRLKWFVGVLLLFVVIQGFGSVWLLYNWTNDLRNLQAAIREHPIDNLPELSPSRELDLQPIVQAFNDLNKRLKSTRQDSIELSRRLGQADRLTLLGKMAAGIAHEIRNPMATVRIKLENIAVSPAERFSPALPVLIDQVDRVDRLIQMLLAMTRPFNLKIEEVDLQSWYTNSFPSVFDFAASRGVRVKSKIEVGVWRFDAFNFGRAVENVLHNAIAFTPEGGEVVLSARERQGRLLIDIQDQGRGLSESERATLFQPFMSHRENGTGLGLVLAREIIEAHGGSITEVGDATGACFRMEMPWQKF